MLLLARQPCQFVARDQDRGQLALSELGANVIQIYLHIKLRKQAGVALLHLAPGEERAGMSERRREKRIQGVMCQFVLPSLPFC